MTLLATFSIKETIKNSPAGYFKLFPIHFFFLELLIIIPIFTCDPIKNKIKKYPASPNHCHLRKSKNKIITFPIALFSQVKS